MNLRVESDVKRALYTPGDGEELILVLIHLHIQTLKINSGHAATKN